MQLQDLGPAVEVVEAFPAAAVTGIIARTEAAAVSGKEERTAASMAKRRLIAGAGPRKTDGAAA